MEQEQDRGSWSFSRWALHVRQPALRLPEPAGDSLDPFFILGVR